jgi:hypothetical protein
MLQLNGFFQEREEMLQSPQCCCSSMVISKSLKNCSTSGMLLFHGSDLFLTLF